MMRRFVFVFLSFFCVQVGFAQNEIKLEDIYGNRVFAVETVNGIVSMKDGEKYTTLENYREIVQWDYKTGKSLDTLVSLVRQKFGIKYIYDYSFNTFEDKVIISTNIEPIYRHSFKADFYVIDLKTNQAKPLSENGQQQLADFSPDGKNVAFFQDNNLFVKNLLTNETTQITFDGKKNEIINGAPDWVYEEEFGFNKAFVWSPDGSKIAFMKFDERKVKTYGLTYYDNLYPTIYEYKYPKAGEDNSVVSVHLYNLQTRQTVQADVGKETNQYIPRIKWTQDPSKLAIIRLNRLQNQVDVLICDAISGSSSVLFSESNKYYISEVNDAYINFLPDKQHFVISSERDGYNHLYLYNMAGKMVKQLTSGNYDVNDYFGYNASSKSIFYSSSEPSPLQKAVYSVKLDGTGKQLLTPQAGTNKAEFNSTFTYFINTWSNANTPPIVSLCNTKGKVMRVLEQNVVLAKNTIDFNFGKKEFFEFKNPEGITLMGYTIKPANFDATKKYPLFMFVYGGPESQEVTDEWDHSVPWFHLLAQKGYIVACVDNRGTDNRGEAFRKSTYMQLGKLETQDQIAAAKYLGSLNYIDKSRIGIFGWSYGGYMSSLCMTRGQGLFKLGIAVAPVTNWRYYDNVYTERFMRTPQENPSGYDDNSPNNYAKDLQGKFLLIHGSGDDNVHVQNTMDFAEKLIQANKQFEMMIYPDKNHGIYGGNTRLQLYTKMTNFILNNL